MKLAIPEENFNLELEMSTAENKMSGQLVTDVALTLVNHCKELTEAGAEVRLISANEKISDLLKGSPMYNHEEFTTDAGATYAGKLNCGGKMVTVANSALIPGVRIITSRGIVTYIVDGIREL